MPVLEITQAADVGMGSFYNHFDSKEQLFEAAVAEVLDAHGALLDRLTATIEDPAETFATSFRLTGRLFRHARRRAGSCWPTGWRCSARTAAWPRARCATSTPRSRPAGSRSRIPNSPWPWPAARCWDWASLLHDQNPTAMTPRPPSASPRRADSCSACLPMRR